MVSGKNTTVLVTRSFVKHRYRQWQIWHTLQWPAYCGDTWCGQPTVWTGSRPSPVAGICLCINLWCDWVTPWILAVAEETVNHQAYSATQRVRAEAEQIVEHRAYTTTQHSHIQYPNKWRNYRQKRRLSSAWIMTTIDTNILISMDRVSVE